MSLSEGGTLKPAGPFERPLVVTIKGELSTDCDCVYVNGMTLANALVAAIPNYERRKYPHTFDFPGAEIEVTVTYRRPRNNGVV